MESGKGRPMNGVAGPSSYRGHDRALDSIRADLARYQVPSSSASSSGGPSQGAAQPALPSPADLLQSLTAQGFSKEDVWLALKLTNFRSESAAREVLQLSAPHRHRGSPGVQGGVSQAQGGLASPPTPTRTAMRVSLQPPSSAHSSLGQPSPDLLRDARDSREPKDPRDPTRVLSARLNADSVSCVRIEVGPSPSASAALAAHHQLGAYRQAEGSGGGSFGKRYEMEASGREGETLLKMQADSGPWAHYADSSLGVHRIPISDSPQPPPQPNLLPQPSRDYINSLLSRADQVMSRRNDSVLSSSVVPETTKAAGSAGAVAAGGGGGGVSPGSTGSSESWAGSGGVGGGGGGGPRTEEGVVRCVSPLPAGLREKVEKRPAEADAAVKPCTAKAFKFFIEQHVENVLKAQNERARRALELEMEMERAGFEDAWRSQMKRILADKESHYLRRRRQRMRPDMFHHVKVIGAGAYGEVSLVKKKGSRKAYYAMKTLKKDRVLSGLQAAHVRAERDILSEAANDFIVKLYYSFQDRDHLFFIMEYIPGGDMMSLLIKKGRFDEELARFYIAELTLAIEYVHRLGFIHRDIKPDNIVIDRSGHIKLTDFGLCTGLRWTHDKSHYDGSEGPTRAVEAAEAHLRQDSLDSLSSGTGTYKVLHRRQRRRRQADSLVGTPNYIAPEILAQTGHSALADWWSVGVILYEMVVGMPPFYAEDPHQTQLKVLHWPQTFRIPPEAALEAETEDVLLGLIQDEGHRLGCRLGANDLKTHPYFRSVDFVNIRSSPAPYVPLIEHEEDTSNFDPPEPQPQPSSPKAEKPKGDHAFYEFTFRRFFDSDPQGCPTLRRTGGPALSRPSLAPLLEHSPKPPPTSTPASSTPTSTAPAANHLAHNISVLQINNEDSAFPAHSTSVHHFQV